MKIQKTAAAFLFTITGAAFASDPPVVRDGRVLSPSGATLYAFDMDSEQVSRCGRVCVMVWLPLTGDSEDGAGGPFTLMERDDGTRQWTYRGRPLYRFIGDRVRGDALGDGMGGAWHVVMP